MIARLGRDRLAWVAIGLFGLYLALVLSRPSGVFWSLDEGGKFLYLENVLRTGDPRAPLEYPGRALDPALQFVPLFYYARAGEALYAWWPVGFPLLTLPFYLALGWAGLYLLPAAGGAASAGLAGWLVRRLAKPARPGLAEASALIVGLATPIAFYSAVYWEHSLSAALLMAAVACLVQAEQTQRWRWALAAGGVGAAAGYLRPDLLSMLAGAGLVLLLRRWRWAVAFAAGAGVIGLAGAALNVYLMGHPVSRQIESIDQAGLFMGLREAGLAFVPWALFNAPRVLALALSPPALVFGMAALGLALGGPFGRRWGWASVAGQLGLAALGLWVLASSYGYRSVHGYVLIAPVVASAAWIWRARRDGASAFFGALVLAMTAAYFGVYGVRSWVAAGGLQWGPRYMLALYPLHVAAAVVGLAAAWPTVTPALRRGLLAALAAVALVGAGFEVRGQAALHFTVGAYERARRALAGLPPAPMITRCTWMPMVIPELYWGGSVFASTDRAAWEAAAARTGAAWGYVIDMDGCADAGLDEVARRLAANPSGVTVERVEWAPAGP